MTDTTSISMSSVTTVAGSGQADQGVSLVAFITALAFSVVIFAIQVLAFILLKDKLKLI